MQISTKRGNWTDDNCYYVTCVDGSRVAQIAGPFQTKEQAEGMVDKANEVGCQVDPKAHFYAWGVSKWKNGYRDGILNKQLGILQ